MEVPPGGIQYEGFLAKAALLVERGERIAEAARAAQAQAELAVARAKASNDKQLLRKAASSGNTSGTRVSRMPSSHQCFGPGDHGGGPRGAVERRDPVGVLRLSLGAFLRDHPSRRCSNTS